MGRAKLTPREESLKPIIAGNIKKYLDEFNKKPADLQRGTGIAQSTISDYTSGKTLVNPGNVEKIASFFGVLKSDIDPRFSDEWVNENEFPIIEQTVETMKKLEEPRQKIVLDTASSQLKEQEEQNKVKQIEDYRLTDEYLDEQISKASAYGGGQLNDNDKEFFKRLLKNTLKEKIDKGDL